MKRNEIRDALELADDDDIANEYENRGLQYDTVGDCDTNDLIQKLEERGFEVNDRGDSETLMEKAYEKYRRGESIDTDIRAIFWHYLGRIA